MADDAFDDWETIGRKTNDKASALIGLLLWPLFLLTGSPTLPSSVTWTIRHKQTGDVRRVTAHTKDLAALKIAAGEFDKT